MKNSRNFTFTTIYFTYNLIHFNRIPTFNCNTTQISINIQKLAITTDWAYNRYTDSKKEYRKISAAVLFSDKDNDGVCRFVTYNFISDKSGNGWTTPRFHSFCNG